MATDIKISQMPSATTLEGGELIPIVQSSTNKTITVNKIKEGLATTAQLENKVDKDGNKVLSEKNFTAAYETKLKGIAENANNYVHPSGSGNNHIPAGGSSGQVLVWASDGTATWGSGGATYSVASDSTLGLVKQGVAVADATSAEDVVAVVNALLASLRTSGAIAPNAAAAASLNLMSTNTTTPKSSSKVSEPINFVSPMLIQQGKWYKEDGVTYECIQTSKLPISNKLKDLVGYYVKVVK